MSSKADAATSLSSWACEVFNNHFGHVCKIHTRPLYYDGSAALASERAAISFTRGRLDDDALEIWNDYREKATGGCWKRIRQKVRR